MDGARASAARVGFVLFVAMVLVIAAVYLVGDGVDFLRDHTRYHVLFTSTAGLRNDARVYLSGVPVGKVEQIGFSSDPEQRKIQVTLEVDSKAADRIREDSFAWIQSETLLGEKAVYVKAGDPQQAKVQRGGVIKQMDRTLIQDLVGAELVSGTTDLLENMITLLKDINAGKGTLGQLLRNPDLYNSLLTFSKSLQSTTTELDGITKDLREIIGEIRQQKGTLGKLIFSEDYALELRQAVERANHLMGQLARVVEPVAKGEGSLGRLLRDDSFHQNLSRAVSNFASTTESLDRSLKAMREERSVMGRMFEDPELGKRFERLVENLEKGTGSLEQILAKINSGEGSVGMLIDDPSIAVSLRNIFAGVQENNLLLSVARHAEEKGQEIRMRDEMISRRTSREEIGRDQRRAPEEGDPRPSSGLAEEGVPAPAVAPGDGKTPGPSPAAK